MWHNVVTSALRRIGGLIRLVTFAAASPVFIVIGLRTIWSTLIEHPLSPWSIVGVALGAVPLAFGFMFGLYVIGFAIYARRGARRGRAA